MRLSDQGVLMYRFLVVIEKANGNCLAYSPDISGCVCALDMRLGYAAGAFGIMPARIRKSQIRMPGSF